MNFNPLHDRVLVKRVDQEAKTSGGIIIPDTAQEKPMEGEVIAVGAGVRDDQGKLQKLDVTVGDRVLFGKWSGTEIKLDGQDLMIMKESDILGILTGKSAIKPAAKTAPKSAPKSAPKKK